MVRLLLLGYVFPLLRVATFGVRSGPLELVWALRRRTPCHGHAPSPSLAGGGGRHSVAADLETGGCNPPPPIAGVLGVVDLRSVGQDGISFALNPVCRILIQQPGLRTGSIK
jgi:hypothetical protein